MLVLALNWALLVGWGAVSLAATLMPGPFFTVVQGPLLMLFVLTHAALAYGWRGAAILVTLAFLVGLAWENLSIATGVPFGFFSHSHMFGTRIGAVPIVVALGYFIYGYPAWMLARLIDGDADARPGPFTPYVAMIIVTGFDLTCDPIGASVLREWQYRTPSGLNGVPLTNYLGWLMTTATIYLLWAWLSPRFDRAPRLADRGFWLPPVLFWCLTAAQYPLLYATSPRGSVTIGSRTWVVADIYETATIIALVVMGFSVLLATSRVFGPSRRGDF